MYICVCVVRRSSEAEVVPVRQIDNSAVLAAQLARLAAVKQSRADAKVAAALQVGGGAGHRVQIWVGSDCGASLLL